MRACNWHRAGLPWSWNHLIDRADYRYDAAGNRLGRNAMIHLLKSVTLAEDADVLDQEYQYDRLDRLTVSKEGYGHHQQHMVASPQSERRWGLDQLGNWGRYQIDADGDGLFSGLADTDAVRTHNEANELTSAADATDRLIAYDGAGNLSQGPLPRGGAEDDTFSFVYDAWNRLVAVWDEGAWDLDNGGQGNPRARYAYDGLNRRVWRTEGFDTTHYYYNQQWQCVEERATESGPATREYLWHPHYVDALAVSYGGAGAKHYYLEEALLN